MARKKVTTTVEETEEAPRDPQQFIADERASKFLGEEVVNGKVVDEPKEEVVEEKPVEEAPIETPQDAPKEEVVEFDPEKLKHEAAAEARAEILKALAEGTPQEKGEKLDDYQQYQKDFLAKENRQPTWFEVARFMEEKAVAKIEAKQAQQLKDYETQTTKQRQEQEQQIAETNKYVDATVNELYTQNKLPKIVNKDDPDDYGNRVKREFFSTIIKVNQDRLTNKLPPKTIKEVFYEDFTMPKKEVAGADAPVNMGRGGYSPDESETIDYQRDIAGSRNSIRNILNRAFKAR